jgi:hypothetical protein
MGRTTAARSLRRALQVKPGVRGTPEEETRSRSFRRLARRAPALTWAFTAVVMLATGTMLVRGADGIDPSNAWRRCCRYDLLLPDPEGLRGIVRQILKAAVSLEGGTARKGGKSPKLPRA